MNRIRSRRKREKSAAQRLPAILIVVVISLAFLAAPARSTLDALSPALPAAYLDTTSVSPNGGTIPVRAGGDLQAALDSAPPGDTIVLEAGATFRGNFTLPKKSGPSWIVIRSSAPDIKLPAPGTRVTPTYAASMPKVVSPNSAPALQAAPGAHHYRLIAIELSIASHVKTHYNIVALGGFVAFILVTFYSKLHLRAVHAYIIPVGLGVLLLQELFRQRTKPEARNWIRLVTLMSMLGSSGYYALADPRHAIAFNLTMIVLCLLAMGLGSFFRIRLYLAMGFAGLMVDLVSILYKVLVTMERSARMTVIGSLVLVIGALLVFGAIYYKTKKSLLDVWLDKWRGKLGQWE